MSYFYPVRETYEPASTDNPCSPEATAERRKRWRTRMKERIAHAEQRGLLHEAKCLRADLRRG